MPSPKQLDQKTILQDINAFNGLKSIPNYVPTRPDLTLNAMEECYQNMKEAQRYAAEITAQQKKAIAAKIAAEQVFHDKVQSVKSSVRGQFGPDSDEVQVVGLKKQSQRKRPTTKAKTAKVVAIAG